MTGIGFVPFARVPVVAYRLGERSQREVRILRGHVSSDQVPWLVSIPPQVTISRLVQWLKGRSSHHLSAEFVQLRKAFRGRHGWARGYSCCRSGNVTDEVIKK